MFMNTLSILQTLPIIFDEYKVESGDILVSGFPLVFTSARSSSVLSLRNRIDLW